MVVRKLSEVFLAKGADVRLFRMEKSEPARVERSHIIGLAFPVAVQSTYPLVWKFIEKLPPAPATGIFMVDTLAGFSGGVVGPLRKILSGKGYRPLGAAEIVMPNNFLPSRIDPEENTEKIAAGLEKAEKFADSLLDGTSRWGRVPILSDLICGISRSGLVKNYLRKKGKRLTVQESVCTRCGICSTLCPVGNIYPGPDKYPVFSDRCQQCMRCFSFCPTGAITVPGKKYQVYRAVKAGEILKEDKENILKV